MSAAGSQRHCRVCGDPDHRTRECPTIQSDEDIPDHVARALSMDAESEMSGFRKGQRGSDVSMLEALQNTQTPKRAPRSRKKMESPNSAWEEVTPYQAQVMSHRIDTPPATASAIDLTEAEMKRIVKSREKRNVTRQKKEETMALSGLKADYPSLSHAYSLEVPFNIVECLRSRMITFMWKKLFWQARVKQAVEMSMPGARWKKNRRWLAGLLGKEIGSLYGHYGAMRQRLSSPVGVDLM